MLSKYKKQQWNAYMHLTSSSDTINTLMNKSNYVIIRMHLILNTLKISLTVSIHKKASNTKVVLACNKHTYVIMCCKNILAMSIYIKHI